MQPNSKVWIYQASNKFDSDIEENILAELQLFCKHWTAHAKQLLATAEIKYNQFIILIVDESNSNASGCSIDSSVHFLQDLEKKYGINLFNRMLFTFKENDEIKTLNKSDFQIAVNSGRINSETIVYNNLVNTYQNFQTQWEIAFENSWHKNLFSVPVN